jgi:hypothetical protein
MQYLASSFSPAANGRLIRWLFSGLCLLLWLPLQAQKPFSNAANFVQDVQRVIERKTDPTTTEVVSSISNLWGTLSPEEQKLLHSISKTMYDKGYQPNPIFEDFYACLHFGQKTGKFKAADRLRFLQVADTTVREVGKNGVANFFRITRTFITDHLLYKYQDHTAFAILGNRDFEFGYGREGAPAVVEEPITDPIEEIIKIGETATKEKKDPKTEEADTGGWDDWGSDWGSSGTGSDMTTPDPDVWGTADEWETPSDDWGSDGDWGWGGEADKKKEKKKTVVAAAPIERPKLAQAAPEDPETRPLAGPYIRFKNVNLNVKNREDEFTIQNTDGFVLLSTGEFVGEKGRFDWKAEGVEAGVYCEFSKYVLPVTKAQISAKSVSLIHPTRLDSAVLGNFAYKALKQNKTKNPPYPIFISYRNDIKVKGLAKDLTYIGGFGLKGNRITSQSLTEGAESSIVVEKGGKPKFKATSTKPFIFNANSVNNPQAKLIIYTSEKDSLMHPGMMLRFSPEGNGKSQEAYLLARKDNKVFKDAPIEDSYHRVSVLADLITWDLGVDTMNIAILQGRNETPVVITSNDHFYKPILTDLQGLYSFNPLVMIWGYISNKKPFSPSFFSADMARDFKQNPLHVKQAMRFLAGKGFVEYDEATDWTRLTRKGQLYARANLPPNNPMKVDYDKIIFAGQSNSLDNITYYFEDNEMHVRGVKAVRLAQIRTSLEQDSAFFNVVALPSDGIVKIKENRNMSFSGQVGAKNFVFNGKDFEFNYEEFKIVMPRIDSMQFYVEGDTLPNNFKDVSGTFFINHPSNRSGERTYYDKQEGLEKLSFRNYPIFESTSGGQVKFAGKEILMGSYYDTARVKFDVDNFRLDSLVGRKPEDLKFAGTFNSNIFVEQFRDSIRVMEDKSLGFVHDVNDPQHPSGLGLYGGKGRLEKGLIFLTNDGVRAGAEKYYDMTDSIAEANPKKKKLMDKEKKLYPNSPARLTYLAAEIESNDFIFFPDSMVSLGAFKAKAAYNKGRIHAKKVGSAGFPNTFMEDFHIRWLHAQDSMLLTSLKKPFEMYKRDEGDIKVATHTGTLVVAPSGLKGYGAFETDEALITSQEFAFETTRFHGNHALFQIKSEKGVNPAAIAANNVKFDYNIIENPRTATIEAEEVGEKVFTFPFLKYKTSLAKAVWSLDAQNVVFRQDDTGASGEQIFESTDPAQLGLKYAATNAIYDMREQQLNIEGVPYILVVDTEIAPYGSKVVVKKGGRIEPLKNAELTVNYLSRYHRLVEGSINIVSKEEYKGKAIYKYTNDAGEEFDINIDNFGKQVITELDLPDSLRKTDLGKKLVGTEGTVSTTTIKEEEFFRYADGKQFKDQVTMKAWLRQLEFNGQARLVSGNSPQSGWFPLVSTAAGANTKGKKGASSGTDLFVINQSVNGQPSFVGLYLSKEKGLYAPIMEEDKAIGRDIPIFLAEGAIKKSKVLEFAVVSTNKDGKPASEPAKGNVFDFSKTQNEVRAEGTFTLYENSARVNLATAGRARANYAENRYTFDLMLAFSIDSKGEAFNLMRDHLATYVSENRTKNKIERVVKKNPTTVNKVAEIGGDRAAENFLRRFSVGDYGISDAISDKTLIFPAVTMNWSVDRNAFYSVGDLSLGAILKKEIDAKCEGMIEIPRRGEAGDFTLYFELDPDTWYYIAMKSKDLKMLSSNEAFNAELENPKSKDKFEKATRAEVDAFRSRFRSTYDTTPAIALD